MSRPWRKTCGVLAMGALSEGELAQALGADADVVVWSERQVRAVQAAGGGRVHVKLDSGMGRLGTRDPAQASRAVAAARDADGVELVGLMTHFATADDPNDDGFFAMQLGRFTEWAAAVKAEQPGLIVHAANSAALLREAGAQLDMVRCGIAVYGMDPFGEDPTARGLEPALELSSYVAEVKRCEAGESAGYGRRFVAERDTWLAVLPIGYGDGWRRGCSNNADVLIAGRRYPVVGTVSMDNITVDLGPDAGEELLGEEAILIGSAVGRRERRHRPMRSGRRADHGRGRGEAAGHDQLRGHVRAHPARAAALPPRRHCGRATDCSTRPASTGAAIRSVRSAVG